MQIDKIIIIYFSPTHTSRTIARAVADGIGWACREEIDLTTDFSDAEKMIENALCIVTAPVYGGLIAPPALKRLARIKARNCATILACTYGNRDFEDALVQLRETLVQQGFTSLSAGAFIGEHSFSRPNYPIAEGRPDADDVQKAQMFGRKSWEKLCQMLNTTPQMGERHRQTLMYEQPLSEALQSFFISGNMPWKTLPAPTPQKPVVSDACNGCGTCVDICPTAAISIENGRSDTDISRCIKCCACVKECPVNARTFDTPYTPKLHELCSARREPELFF